MSYTEQEMVLHAQHLLGLNRRIAAKLFMDPIGPDVREELEEISELLEEVEGSLAEEELAAVEQVCPPPRVCCMQLLQTVESLLVDHADMTGLPDEPQFVGIMTALRSGDLNFLLQHPDLLLIVHDAVGGAIREGGPVETFFQMLSWLERYQRALEPGPLSPQGPYPLLEDSEHIHVDDDEEEEEDDWYDEGDFDF